VSQATPLDHHALHDGPGLRWALVAEHFPLLEAPCSAYLDEGVLVAAAPGEPGPLVVSDADLEVGGRPGGVALHVDEDVVHMMAKAGVVPVAPALILLGELSELSLAGPAAPGGLKCAILGKASEPPFVVAGVDGVAVAHDKLLDGEFVLE